MFLRVAVFWFTEFSMEGQTNLHKLHISLCVFTNAKLRVIPFQELKTTVFIMFFTFLLQKLSCKSWTNQTRNTIVSFKLQYESLPIIVKFTRKFLVGEL